MYCRIWLLVSKCQYYTIVSKKNKSITIVIYNDAYNRNVLNTPRRTFTTETRSLIFVIEYEFYNAKHNRRRFINKNVDSVENSSAAAVYGDCGARVRAEGQFFRPPPPEHSYERFFALLGTYIIYDVHFRVISPSAACLICFSRFNLRRRRCVVLRSPVSAGVRPSREGAVTRVVRGGRSRGFLPP